MPFSDLSSHFETILLKRINLSLKFNPNLILIILKKSKTISSRSKVAFECYSGHNFHFLLLAITILFLRQWCAHRRKAKKRNHFTVKYNEFICKFIYLFIIIITLLQDQLSPSTLRKYWYYSILFIYLFNSAYKIHFLLCSIIVFIISITILCFYFIWQS